ncbi:MAG: hypothetical protein ABI700_14875, partial [Chloroflexota bacterium]
TWWQVQFAEGHNITRLGIAPWLESAAGVPHFELVASNTGDFLGEEVSLLETDLTDNTFTNVYNQFDFTNGANYTYYRINISGETDVVYAISEVYMYELGSGL